jgi:hypothetical protein
MKDEQDCAAEKSGETPRTGDCPENLKPYRWKKGQPSPNPGGRPKKAPISDAYAYQVEVHLPDDIRTRLRLPKGATWADGIAVTQIRAALKGNTVAAKEIADRIEGRTRLPVAVETPEDGELCVQIVHIGERYEEPKDEKQAGSQNPAAIKPKP